MRPERGLVARAALEAPDGSFVVRRLARRVPSPGRGEDPRPRGIDGREVAPELEDDLEDPERDDEEHELGRRSPTRAATRVTLCLVF